MASEEIFKIASMAPGALLLEAQKEYEVISKQLLRFPRCSLPFSFPDRPARCPCLSTHGKAGATCQGEGAAGGGGLDKILT